ncbi:hypothetical protein [Aurantiacibacter poecillastricola]|uniref:hypothetical protein n=1 Tax=Aurantiacibacter poecillastricola TaxID=3064385 RepID=UPI00273D2375|nr:hypothetical protein [Aurantiacibacter sp. 219JJ12-13]MDP5262231.1 hypothetical protein [Aurantiacibacter sp. 219JJ12-13]
MRKTFVSLALASLAATAIAPIAVAAQDAPAQTNAAYSVETTKVAVLLDDPEAAAILERLIPTVYANEMFHTMGRSQTLKAIQQFEPDALSDEKLAEIQAAFDELANG